MKENVELKFKTFVYRHIEIGLIGRGTPFHYGFLGSIPGTSSSFFLN